MNEGERENPTGNIALKIVIVDKVDVVEVGRWNDCGWSSPGWRGSWRKNHRSSRTWLYVFVCVSVFVFVFLEDEGFMYVWR
jgi:hypothetical protein